MKRIFLFLLIAVSFTAFSQVQIPQEYSIQRPLQLQTVNAGSKSDSVLVRGSDKIVKFVPRSEFGGGSTEDLNIDGVLGFGNQAHDKNLIFNSIYSNRTISLGNNAIVASSGVDAKLSLFTSDYIESGDGTTYMRFMPDRVRMTNSIAKSIDLVFPAPTDNVELFMPNKNGILATIDDIVAPSLDQVLAVGKITSNNMQFKSLDNLHQLGLSEQQIGMVDYDLTKSATLISGNIKLTSRNNDTFKAYIAELDSKQGLILQTNENQAKAILASNLITTDRNLELPDVSGTLATLDDINIPYLMTKPTFSGIDGNSTYINWFTGSESNRFYQVNVGNSSQSSTTVLGNTAAILGHNDVIFKSRFSAENGRSSMILENRDTNKTVFVSLGDSFTDVANDITYNFDITKPEGSYIIATEPKPYTVSTLPTGTIGDMAYVTDATSPTYLGTLTGGGSVVCPVFYNGTTWVAR